MNYTFSDLVDLFISLLNQVVILIFSLTFLFILWKVTDTWILNAGDETKRTAGKQVVITATWVLLIMVGIWGVLAILRASIFNSL